MKKVKEKKKQFLIAERRDNIASPEASRHETRQVLFSIHVRHPGDIERQN